MAMIDDVKAELAKRPDKLNDATLLIGVTAANLAAMVAYIEAAEPYFSGQLAFGTDNETLQHARRRLGLTADVAGKEG